MKMVLTARPMTSFTLRKNLCKLGWGGSEIFLTIIISKRRSQFTPQYNRGQGVANEFSVIYLLALFNVQLHGESNKADLSCHNTNVIQTATRGNVGVNRVQVFLTIKPSRGTNNSCLLKSSFSYCAQCKVKFDDWIFFSFFTKDDKGTTPTQMCRAWLLNCALVVFIWRWRRLVTCWYHQMKYDDW